MLSLLRRLSVPPIFSSITRFKKNILYARPDQPN